MSDSDSEYVSIKIPIGEEYRGRLSDTKNISDDYDLGNSLDDYYVIESLDELNSGKIVRILLKTSGDLEKPSIVTKITDKTLVVKKFKYYKSYNLKEIRFIFLKKSKRELAMEYLFTLQT